MAELSRQSMTTQPLVPTLYFEYTTWYWLTIPTYMYKEHLVWVPITYQIKRSKCSICTTFSPIIPYILQQIAGYRRDMVRLMTIVFLVSVSSPLIFIELPDIVQIYFIATTDNVFYVPRNTNLWKVEQISKPSADHSCRTVLAQSPCKRAGRRWLPSLG